MDLSIIDTLIENYLFSCKDHLGITLVFSLRVYKVNIGYGLIEWVSLNHKYVRQYQIRQVDKLWQVS